MRAREFVTELGDAPAAHEPNRQRKRSLFHATVDGHWIDVFFDRSDINGTLHITFTVNNNYDAPDQPTSASGSTIKILSTVLAIIKQRLPEYIKKARPPAVSFTAKEDNRARLYRKYFVPVIQDILGSGWTLNEYPNMGMTVFNWRPLKKQDLAEQWTARTVKDYFDSQKNNRVTRDDFTVTHPFDGCIMFRFNTVPDLTRAFFRMSEFYEGNRYAGSPAQDIDMADFLDNFVDRQGQVDYFKFWDGFNITDKAFKSWLKGVGKLGQAEKLIVDAIKKYDKSGPYSIVGVAGNTAATDDHELFHALYYLDPGFRRSVDALLKEFRKQSDYKTIRQVLKTRLQYQDHLDEEIAAYLTGGTQLKMVFNIDPKDWIKKFRALFKEHYASQ